MWLPLPPGVQAQLDKGVLQIDTEYEAREDLGKGSDVANPIIRGNASHEQWADYALTQGMPREEAAGLSRDQIRARFATREFDPDAAGDLALLNEKA